MPASLNTAAPTQVPTCFGAECSCRGSCRNLLDPEMVASGWAELQTLLRLDETLDGIKNPRLKVSALEMNWYMRNQLLRDSDWAGMGHSVEIRVPFVDVDLLRAIAPLLASKHPPTKRDMAATAIPLITSEMLDRRKTGFQSSRARLADARRKSEVRGRDQSVQPPRSARLGA